MTNAAEPPSRLDRLEALLADVGDVVLQNAEVTANHSEMLTRLENSAFRHDEALDRIEGAIAQLTNRVDALTTSTTETIQLVAENSRQIARNNDRIEQILEYLFRERPNGRGGNH
ncbi:MAG: hypothetical protein HC862_16165 [Scytonema sp. RU_4_4]|nr:hypothetical protein [Scytonema sp. RU_4_4]NJR72541.1 hypothetical protein [Scytonema sp. CRU_2_7]